MSNTYLEDANFKFVRISNKDRLPQSQSASRFVVDLKNDTNLHKVVDIYLQSVSVPFVFPNINSSNNRLVIESGVNGLFTSNLPDGFYNITQLLTALKNDIDPQLGGGGAITFSVDPVFNTVSYTVTVDTIKFYTVAEDPLSTMAPTLGNTASQIISNAGLFADIPALQGEQMVFLHSRTLNASKTRISQGQGVSSFASIPVRVDFKSVIQYESFGSTVDRLTLSRTTDLGTVDISLRAQDGRILDLGENHELIVVLKVFYEP